MVYLQALAGLVVFLDHCIIPLQTNNEKSVTRLGIGIYTDISKSSLGTGAIVFIRELQLQISINLKVDSKKRHRSIIDQLTPNKHLGKNYYIVEDVFMGYCITPFQTDNGIITKCCEAGNWDIYTYCLKYFMGKWTALLNMDGHS